MCTSENTRQPEIGCLCHICSNIWSDGNLAFYIQCLENQLVNFHHRQSEPQQSIWMYVPTDADWNCHHVDSDKFSIAKKAENVFVLCTAIVCMCVPFAILSLPLKELYQAKMEYCCRICLGPAHDSLPCLDSLTAHHCGWQIISTQ